MLIYFLNVLLFIIYIERASASGSQSPTTSEDDLIYQSTSISPYFDDGASSALLRPPSFASTYSVHNNKPLSTSSEIHQHQSYPFSSSSVIAKEKIKSTPLPYVNVPKKKRKRSETKRKSHFVSPEARLKMQKSKIGIKLSQSTRAAMSIARRGKVKSEATKQKISQTLMKTLAKKRKEKQDGQGV